MGRVGSSCEVHGRGAGGGVGGGGEGITGKDESVGRRARLAIVHHGVLLPLLKHTHRERETKRLKSETKLFFGGAQGEQIVWILTGRHQRGEVGSGRLERNAR